MHKAEIERLKRETDMDRAELQRQADAKLASNETLERERMAFQNSKEVRVKRAF